MDAEEVRRHLVAALADVEVGPRPELARRRPRRLWAGVWLGGAVLAAAAVVALATGLPGGEGPAPVGTPDAPVATDPSTPPATEAPTTDPSDTPAACPAIAPRELPDGSAPGPTRESVGMYVWGSGARQVSQLAGGTPFQPGDEARSVRSQRLGQVRLVLVGDDGVGEVAGMFSREQCQYTVWLPAGTRLEDAADFFARRY